jgi:peptide/nickel transport system substrate-binding protein
VGVSAWGRGGTAPLLLTGVLLLLLSILLAGCRREIEISPEQAKALQQVAKNALLSKMVTRPGGRGFEVGRVGGSWNAAINSDPKTFNTLTARDADTRAVVDPLFDYLADYDPYKRQFIPNLASFDISSDPVHSTLTVTYTLRNDLYWTNPANDPPGGVKVSSDDVIYWYDEIEGDPQLQLPGYPGQFIDMPDGSQARIKIRRIDERRFAFDYPRIVANPVLSTNMQFGPRYLYEKAKKEGGVEGVLDLFNVQTDVKTIPSIGQYYLTEYSPGVRVVMERNPHYWKKDRNGTSLPYMQRVIYRIVPDQNTEFLLFKQGTLDSYAPRPQDLEELLSQSNPDYTVYNGGENLGSAFFCFNQNPASMDKTVYGWFIQTKFRQAMSCLLNRPRIAGQVYRGLAVPALYFFAKANPFYDPSIRLQYTYDPKRAVQLLGEIGMRQDAQGVMRDSQGRPIEFTINVGAESNIGVDMCNIYADELSKVGIKADVRPIDFQKLVEMLISTYDWEAVTVGLGANYWPSGGSNVWPSSGNFHLWHPLQKQPATAWEATVDRLYNEGRFTLDPAKARAIYDQYQRLLLEQLPVIYIVYPLSFLAVRNIWGNVFFDTLRGLDTTYVYLEVGQ